MVGLTGAPILADGITEWWVYPVANYLTEPVPRTVFGAISATGEILAGEFDHARGTTTRVAAATGGTDDHNAPALWAANGRRGLMAWAQHDTDHLLRLKVSDQECTPASFATAPQVQVDMGGNTTYAQIHRIEHLSDADQDTFWSFSRGPSTWVAVKLSVNQATGAITAGTPFPIMSSMGTFYIITADAHATSGQVIRIAMGYNPAASVHALRYFELDVVTGAITCPNDPAVVANMNGTGLPIVEQNVAAVLGEPSEGYSRRLFYSRPGPSVPAIAYAEWNLTTPDAAVYRVISQAANGSWSITSEHGIAGPRLGYNAEANYIAGVGFPDPCVDDTIAVARQIDGLSIVDLYRGDGSTVELYTSATSRLGRPVLPRGADPSWVSVSDITGYGESYLEYSSDIRALWSAPSTATEGVERVTILCGELRTGRILAEVPVSAASWSQALRDAGSVEVTIPTSVLADRPELLSYLEGPAFFLAAQRGNTILEAGPIWAWDYDVGAGLRVRAAGLLSYFDHRIVMRVLADGEDPRLQEITSTGSDLATIAMRLIKIAETHTGGTLPIVYQSERSGTHERTWLGFELPNMGEEIRALMAVEDGPDIALEPRLSADRLSVEWHFRGGTQAEPMLTQDGDDWEWDASVVRSSVSGLSVSRDWSGLTMRAWSTGEGQDEATLMSGPLTDSTLLTAGYPLMESTEAHSSVSRASTLAAHNVAQIARNRRAWQSWGLTIKGDPHIGDYRPGDWGRAWVPSDHPILSRLGVDYHRTRILGISGGLTDDVSLTLAPSMESR